MLGIGKTLALLIDLSAAPNRSATRNTVISALWSDLEPDGAKHALRQTLWYLKRKSGQDLILTALYARRSDMNSSPRPATQSGHHDRMGVVRVLARRADDTPRFMNAT